MQHAALFLLASLLSCALCQVQQAKSPGDASADYVMGSISTPFSAGEVVADELINGDFAEETLDDLTRGPKVNGGFALNVLPKPGRGGQGATRVVSNSDCAGGRVVDGKCLRPFPRKSRVANDKDNMASPEVGSASAYEPDIHKFVQKHFGQKVMAETEEKSHHVAYPGQQLIDNMMNMNGNDHADTVANSLMPIGMNMMKNGDSEMDVEVTSKSGMAAAGRKRKVLQTPHHAADTPIADKSHEKHTAVDGPKASKTSKTESDPAGSYTGAYTGSYTSGNEEIAEVGIREVPDVKEEVEDVEEIIPHEDVAEEKGLPPTPTPTPTPNLEKIAQEKREAEERAQHVDQCISFLSTQKYECSSAEKMDEKKEEDFEQSLIQHSVTPAGDDVKARTQNMLVQCTQRASQVMLQTNGVKDSKAKRESFSLSLSKYAASMACLNSEDFPQCMPSEAKAMLASQNGDQLKCF